MKKNKKKVIAGVLVAVYLAAALYLVGLSNLSSGEYFIFIFLIAFGLGGVFVSLTEIKCQKISKDS